MTAPGPRQVLIIGSGCAGYTAAIYTGRANLSPLLVSGTEAGGQLMITSDVENFPGFPEGILGPELMDHMRSQALKFGTEFVLDTIVRVDFSKRPFRVWTGEEQLIEARTVIVCTGATAKWIGLPSEQLLHGKGVSACAVCDAAFFKQKRVIVVGGGDTAMEEAVYLTKFASAVTIVHRRDVLRASKIMQERAKKNPKIDFLYNHAVEEVLGKDRVTGVRLKDVVGGGTREVPCDGLFVAIGHAPNTKIFEGQLKLDEQGYIITDERTQTSVPGVFAAGDVQDHRYRQAVTAAGKGCAAALEAERFLESAEPHG